MNIHKYLLPASLAATVHVALLWFLPEGTRPDTILITEVPLLPPLPKKADDAVTPPEPADPDPDPVKPLLGAPAPVALDEPPVQHVDTPFTIPVETVPRDVIVSADRLPPVVGDPNGDRRGTFQPPKSIFDIRLLDRTPRAKVQLPPEYPYAMKRNGTSGSVLVEFDVSTEGFVIRAEALSSSDREFAEAAVRAVRKWQFEPGRRNGKPVPFRMTVPIEFGLENN